MVKKRIITRCQDPKNKKAIHKGKPSNFNKEEKEKIINYVETSISNSISLNYHIVALHVIPMNLDSLKEISNKAKYKMIVRLVKSNFFVIRKSTYLGQSIPKDADEKAMHFLRQVILYRKKNNYDMSCIINCDETAITYDSPLSYSLAKVGLKIVTIKTTEKEKYRVTCLLSITADGGKLKPFIIFKGKKDWVTNKELEEFVKSKKYDIITKTQGRGPRARYFAI